MDCQQQSRQNVHTLDVLFQMPPLSSFCVNIHALSYAVIFGILTSISYQSSQDSHHNLRLTHGGTIQQWGPEYVCLSHSFLSQISLDWSPNKSQSPPTENLITIVAFINIPIAIHDDAIKGHVTRFTECVVLFPTHISSVSNTLRNSLIWRLNALHSVRYLSGRRRGWEKMRDKNILVVKISVHMSLGMRGADTREDVSCFCWVRERGMWDWFLIDERIV